MINHLSVSVQDPRRAAELLARLTGGEVAPFPPLVGAFVCFLDGKQWKGHFIEFYPAGTRLISKAEGPGFAQVPLPAPANGTHINLTTRRTYEEIAAMADELGLKHAPRGYLDIHDVWIEEDLLIEFARG